jgi:GTP1/Obg family GTP-binding protein
MAIGAVKGRTDPGKDRLASYEAARKLFSRFRETFGSTSCRVLNKSDFKSTEHKVRCGRFVAGATSMAMQVLRE